MVEVLALRREILGDQHPDTVESMHNLAITWSNRGRSDDAMAMIVECLKLRRHILGPTYPFTMSSLNILQSWQPHDETI